MNTSVFIVVAAFVVIPTGIFITMGFGFSNSKAKLAGEVVKTSAYQYCLAGVKMGVSTPKECEAKLND